MPTTNLLIALQNIIENPVLDLTSKTVSSNRINSVGEGLEVYIKNAFCGTFNLDDEAKKQEIFSNHFSYLGNQNNPPDIIIKNGDAIEVKKLESLNSAIALNSSYPKNKLYADSPMITGACRKCEDWKVKDLLYTIGTAKNKILQSLWFVYGDCYCAEENIYKRIKDKISSGLLELPDIEFAETKELGRVNKVDPLGVTYLRIRGMWHIENPSKVFNYLSEKLDSKFVVNCLMTLEKYNSFPEEDRLYLENLNNPDLTLKTVNIKSPNNPAELIPAKFIQFKLI
jgi:hypothetical protein